MSVGSGLTAGKIDCLVSMLVDVVSWLGIVARDELPYVTRKIRLWCLILNTDTKNQAKTIWLALYAPVYGNAFELFNAFDFVFSIYCLYFLDPLLSLFLVYHITHLYVIITVLFVSIFGLIIIHLVTLFICLLIS